MENSFPAGPPPSEIQRAAKPPPSELLPAARIPPSEIQQARSAQRISQKRNSMVIAMCDENNAEADRRSQHEHPVQENAERKPELATEASNAMGMPPTGDVQRVRSLHQQKRNSVEMQSNHGSYEMTTNPAMLSQKTKSKRLTVRDAVNLTHHKKGVSSREITDKDIHKTNIHQESRTNTRIDYWLAHESMKVDNREQTKDFVGCIYQPTTAEGSADALAVQFVNNWIAVFGALAKDTKNSTLRDKAPVYCAANEFFFCKPMVILTTLLTLYVAALNALASHLDPGSNIASIANAGFNIHVLIMFIWASTICGGSAFERSVKTKRERKVLLHDTKSKLPNATSDTAENDTTANADLVIYGDATVFSLAKAFFCVLLASDKPGSIKAVVQTATDSAMHSHDVESQRLPDNNHPLHVTDPRLKTKFESGFEPKEYDWVTVLSVVTKYIEYGMSHDYFKSKGGQQFKFKSRAKNFLRVAIGVIVIFNAVALAYNILAVMLSEGTICQERESKQCFAARFTLVWSGYGIISFLQGILLYSSIGCVFCGFFLSGDLAHELCKHWAIRFSGLRRVESVQELELPADDDGESWDDGSEVLAPITLPRRSIGAKSIVPSWTNMSGPAPNNQSHDPLNEEAYVPLKNLWKLELLIQRDAYERFLFIEHIMQRSSKTWSAFLGFTFVGSMIFTLLSYIALLHSDLSNYFKVLQTVGGLLVEFLMIAIPVYCLAFANTRVASIHAFGKTAPSDFAILGKDLLGWIRDNKIYWTIFGVAITPTLMQSYAYSFLGIVPTAVVIFAKTIKS